MAKRTKGPDLTIERGRGATYANNDWTVYEHGTYPRHSVLAGSPRRSFIDSFETLDAARAAYPTATVVEGTTYHPPSLSHLSDGPDF